uniref:Uncharacterized protein n=1 Tax=viral metagenome TaxID=1070528 RepID=A0A6M3JNN2_9ZZZZ
MEKRIMELSKDEALEYAITGIEWLSRIIREDGSFMYLYDNRKYKLKKGYNHLRHSGCLWTMQETNLLELIPEIYESTLLKKIDIALNYLKSNHIIWTTDIRKDSQASAIAVMRGGRHSKAGGIALSALALFRSYTKENIRLAKELCDTILYIQNPDGDLKWHKFDFEVLVPTNFISDFYDGECALALVEAYKITKLKKFLVGAEKLIRNRYDFREKTKHIRDHWMIQAIEKLPESWKYMNYANKIIKIIIYDPYDLYANDVFGSLACRTEAIMAWLSIIKKNDTVTSLDQVTAMRDTQSIKIKVLFALQRLLSDQALGRINYGLSTGAFRQNLSSDLIRCDFAQHNISAFSRYAIEDIN